MDKLPKILIVEDHPLFVEGCRLAILEMGNLYMSHCGSVELARQSLTNNTYDIVILDLNLAKDEVDKIAGGFELGKWIRQHFSNCKIVVVTSHEEKCVVYDVIKALHPDAFLLKRECSTAKIKEAISAVYNGDYYYDDGVKLIIRDINNTPVLLDHLNRQILILLAQGILTKNLPDHLPLSLSSIDKRKSTIRDIFGLMKATDEDLIREAKRARLI